MPDPFAAGVAIGSGATFVARSIDVMQGHLKETLKAAAAHRGSAFVEIYQNCNIFNDKAFAHLTDKEQRDEAMILLEHGKPMVFGKGRDKGIRLNGTCLEVVTFADGFGPEDCLVWGESQSNPAIAFMATQMRRPELPTPIGVPRKVDTAPFEKLVIDQIESETARRGPGDLAKLLHSGDTWTVREDGRIA